MSLDDARDYPSGAFSAASALIDRQSGPEDQVRQDMQRLLDAFGIENLFSYQTKAGPADIYLPRRRVFIETKAPGGAVDPYVPQQKTGGESAFDQVKRYLTSEAEDERHLLPHEEDASTPWTAIVTDGNSWHAWLFEPTGRFRQQVLKDLRPGTAEELLVHISPLLAVVPVGKPWIPTDPRPVFRPFRMQLQEVFETLPKHVRKETDTKFQLWRDMLRAAQMEPDSEFATTGLFVTHSFLVALAKGVISALATPDQRPDAQSLLQDGFAAWISDTQAGTQWSTSFFRKIHEFDWRRHRGDVLRPLYETFIDPGDRKDFGEFYTPDWLAELMVQSVLDDEWCETAIESALVCQRTRKNLSEAGVLDPTCGSGTFLYHAARRILESTALRRQQLDPVTQASIVAALVNGVDVHPVAAEIARATVLRSLPAVPPGGASAIRVYEGDALSIRSASLFTPRDDSLVFTSPGGREVFLPESFADAESFEIDLRRLVEAAKNRESVPPDLLAVIPDKDRKLLVCACEDLAKITESEGNSVWTWFIANATGPRRLARRKIDRIVANPPWVSMAGIQNEQRKQALVEFATNEAKIWTGGKNAPHFDIAQVFIRASRDLYLEDPASNPAGWLVKRSALQSEGWSKFRAWHREVLAQSLDLDEVKPFGSGDARRCCVLFDCRPCDENLTGAQGTALRARLKGEEPVRKDMSWSAASERLTFEPAPRPFPRLPSDYSDESGNPLFRQGASITPKVLSITNEVAPVAGRPAQVRVTTVKSNKPPWSEVEPQIAEFPKHWLRDHLTSNDLFVFAVNPILPRAIVPLSEGGTLAREPERESESWNRFEKIYREHRGHGSSTPPTLLRQIDHYRKLAFQLGMADSRSTLVAYPTSGDIMRAARLRPGSAILGHTLHYFVVGSAQESAYLVGLLNAPTLRRAFLEVRSSGRHFVNSLWRAIPIPKYDKGSRLHQEIAGVTVEAEQIASDLLRSLSSPIGQLAASNRIRRLLKQQGVLDRIDGVVRQLLPDHATD